MLAGFSLGSFETLVYCITNGTSVIGMRLFTSQIIHLACAGLSGIFVYSCKMKPVQILPFVFSVLFHGVYNYLTIQDAPLKYASFIAVLIALFECRLRYKAYRLRMLPVQPPLN